MAGKAQRAAWPLAGLRLAVWSDYKYKIKEETMGMIDRDYMKDQRRQRPFSPPPERSGTSTLIIVIIFVAALFALYQIADWKLDQRTARNRYRSGRDNSQVHPTTN
ncbi:hypothetical protein LP414_15865 [Polaromonas sp. P1(28)-13]|nr:hypothetical protein LP414_15865 [Polaromonas sp. P1(28)-13]